MRRQPPFLIGISNYIWNIDIGYRAIQILKRHHPDTIVVGGGPNYPDELDDQIQFLRDYPEIDFYIYKDGEKPFTELVGFLLENPDVESAKAAQLSSCHALVNGEPLFGETAKRVRDLTTLPSPYTMGLMDKFFERNLVPTIQTNRGCPGGSAEDCLPATDRSSRVPLYPQRAPRTSWVGPREATQVARH